MKSDGKYPFDLWVNVGITCAGTFLVLFNSEDKLLVGGGILVIVLGIFSHIESIGRRIRDDVIDELKSKKEETNARN